MRLIRNFLGRTNDQGKVANTHKFSHVKYQFLAVICVNLSSMAHGMSVGWLSPAMLVLMGKDSPMVDGPIDINLIGWIGAVSNIGGIFGNFFFSWVTQRYGRRKAMALMAIPNIVFWIAVFFLRHAVYLIPVRIIVGLTGGGVFICVPLFVAEIASDHVRGSLGAILAISLNLGILISYITGSYLEYHIVPCVHIVFPILFFISALLLPETPQFLIKQGKPEEAERSLRFYKGCRNDTIENRPRFEREMERLANLSKYRESMDTTPLTLRDFWNPAARRGIFISIAMMSIYIISGNLLMLNYAANIFKESGSTLDPQISSIIVITVQLIGTYISIFFVDRLGRRLLMIVSTSGTGIALTIMGVYYYLYSTGVDLGAFDWVPVTSLSLSVFMASMGMFPLVFVVIAEVLPIRIREIGSTFCLALISVFLLIIVKVYVIAVEAFGFYTGFWFFACVCLFGLLFSIFILPETMGKNINQSNSTQSAVATS